MFVAIEHVIKDPDAFWQKVGDMLASPPSGMQLHSTMISERHSLCQCMWEAESIDVVRDYLEPELGGISVNTYYHVDPDTAIG
ncbi:hypothetical protein [Photobacterium atrarenae]|uniref:DUF4286 family protein n=1 Tax=Photobacterium atrarenae TaxID=865757 RepID=A0ABY5GM29_9GAMM|nr:hypothetical protein [Photobacterium atrarenae]UTV30382.1 hypothetical protein NNL38_17550 [Photobacterium atrarenae]